MLTKSDSTNIIDSGYKAYNRTPTDPLIKNIVATLNLGGKVDLNLLAKKCRNVEYNPKRFAAAIIRIKDPKTTCLVFNSGKMVVTGAVSISYCKLAARTFAKMVRMCDANVMFRGFKIQNVVSVANVKFPIRLEALQMQYKQFCEYEPEIFPGAIYRLMHPKVVLLIFVSGRVVITGAKKFEDTKRAFDSIYPVSNLLYSTNNRARDVNKCKKRARLPKISYVDKITLS